MKVGNWQTVDGFKTRKLEYSVVINSTIGVKECKNIEEQVKELFLLKCF